MDMMQEIKDLESSTGFPVRRNILKPERKESYDESFSYGLCQRFYNKEEELDAAIKKTTSIILGLLNEKSPDFRQTALFLSLLGNMYYLKGDFKKAIGCFMKSLSWNKEDMAPWIELMFALRASGSFREFESIIFSIEKIYDLWKSDPAKELSKEKIYQLINAAV